MASPKAVEQFAPTGSAADKLLAYSFEAPERTNGLKLPKRTNLLQ